MNVVVLLVVLALHGALSLSLSPAILQSTAALPVCQESDYHYEYTECDSSGGRWRVAVPKDVGRCQPATPSQPVRGKQCDFTCSPGEFLDIDTDQECRHCPAGTFSLGGGVLFKDWRQLPTGFAVSLYSFASSSSHRGSDTESDTRSKCSGEGWVTRGSYITAINSECVAELVYTATLVRSDSVVFEYQKDISAQIFTFQVENDRCESPVHHKYLVSAGPGEWRQVSVKLKAGVNTLLWQVYSLRVAMTTSAAVKIRQIEIRGVAYTSECSSCEAGSYSSAGAAVCTQCPRDMYSYQQADSCTPCHNLTEYAAAGSSECSKKPPCTVHHYTSHQTPCLNGQTRKVYLWLAPKLCMGGVSLPASSEMQSCSPCNPGMQLGLSGVCEFCPLRQFSDGLSRCTMCPGSSQPQTAIVYKLWDNLPTTSNLSSFCLPVHDDAECMTDIGWTFHRDYAQTVVVNDNDDYLVLSLDVGGFHGDMAAGTRRVQQIAELSFEFEMQCTQHCEFALLTKVPGYTTQSVRYWTGTQKRSTYTFPVSASYPMKITWAFQRSGDSVGGTLSTDYARIYVINVTNTVEGGAASCRVCPQGIKQDRCISCPAGHYIDPVSVTCTKCPTNTVVNSVNPWGIESCVKCGHGLQPFKGRRCVPECRYVSDSGHRLYDWTSLASIHQVLGPRLFTTSGHAYQHLFNISLCGGDDVAVCSDNMTTSNDSTSTDHSHKPSAAWQVSAYVCQSTLVLSDRHSEPAVSISPVSIGSTLSRVTTEADVNITQLLSVTGFTPPTNMTPDVYIVYTSDIETEACQSGRSTLMVLRCDRAMTVSPVRVELSRLCAVGTCDGCNFVFMMTSQAACPVCTRQDFHTYKTLCVDGRRNVITDVITPCNPAHSGDHLPVIGTKTEPCTVYDEWPIWLKAVVISVPLVLLSGVVLLIVVVYCWLKNRSLQYKYMKLVASASGSGKLPAVETCALDEGEEDDDDDDDDDDAVKVRKGTRFFHKLTMSGASDDTKDDDTFENIRMSHKSLLT